MGAPLTPNFQLSPLPPPIGQTNSPEKLAPDLKPEVHGAMLTTQTTGGIATPKTIQDHYTVLLEMERNGDLRYRIDVRQMEVYGLNQLITQLMMQMAQTTDAKIQQVQSQNIERLQNQRDAQQLDVDRLCQEWQQRRNQLYEGRYIASQSWTKGLSQPQIARKRP